MLSLAKLIFSKNQKFFNSRVDKKITQYEEYSFFTFVITISSGNNDPKYSPSSVQKFDLVDSLERLFFFIFYNFSESVDKLLKK